MNIKSIIVLYEPKNQQTNADTTYSILVHFLWKCITGRFVYFFSANLLNRFRFH